MISDYTTGHISVYTALRECRMTACTQLTTRTVSLTERAIHWESMKMYERKMFPVLITLILKQCPV